MYTLTDDRFITAFSKDAVPVMSVPDGAVVRIRTKDCYMNNLRAENDPRGAADGPAIGCNPATGPIYIEGSLPGDTLKCEILDIETDSYASMRIRPGMGFMQDRVTEPIVRAVALNRDRATLAGVVFPIEPMIGVIGVAPAGKPIDTETPGAHGGNMDCRRICKGSTLYLPIQTAGGLFAIGDVHAQMGDGEVCVCGLECPAWVTIRFSIVHGRQEKWPVLENKDGLYVVASAQTLDNACKLAADSMLDYLAARTDIDLNELILLMSLACDLEICQVVDPLITARMRLRPNILNAAF